MTLQITFGEPFTNQAIPTPEPKPIQATKKMNIRKGLDGSLLIFDHSEIDIVVMPHKNKIIAFPKDETGDHIYSAQSRLFDFLTKKGVIEPDTIQGGNVFGSLQATFEASTEADPVQVAVFMIANFNEEEAPYYDRAKKYEDDFEQWLTEPDDEDSTELGEVPHEKKKGIINRWPGGTAAYGLSGQYRA